FLTAMSLFTLGTFIAMISPNFSILVLGRMLQASGSGMMMPLLMNIILIVFPIEKRGTAMGFFGLVMFVAPAIGPTLSGCIVEHYSLRILFTIILPIIMTGIIYASLRLTNLNPIKDMALEFLSIVLSSISFGGLMYGFSSFGDLGR